MSPKSIFLGISLAALAAGSAGAQSTNSSQFNQSGSNNSASIDNSVPGNANNSGTVIQNGTTNSASVYQRNTGNSGFIQETGTSNQAGQRQVGNFNGADSRQSGDFNGTFVTQIGDTNSLTSTQSGYYNSSTVRQGYAVDASVPNGEFRPANNNVVSINQNGAGLASTVNQRGASAAALPASNNTATVYQSSSGSASTIQQISQITQESRGNYAELLQFIGSTVAPNSSTIIQRFTAAPSTNPRSLNTASVAQQGAGNQSQVTQDGQRNVVTVRTQGGGTSAGLGNVATLFQSGNDLSAQVNTGRTNAFVAGNQASVTQTGNANSAGIFQFANRDTASITQSDGPNTGTASTGGLARAVAGVYQNAGGDAATVTQVGDNLADITQAYGSGSSVSVQQRDAGDVGSMRASNSAVVAQYGTGNRFTVAQDALNAQATGWHKVGSSSNSADIAQGTGRTGQSSTTSTPGFTAGPTGVGTVNVIANVTQAGAYNDATVSQDGATLRADVDQNGSATSGLHNITFVSQTGSGNTARAYQGPGVGPSATGDPGSGNSGAQNGGAPDEFYFGGGARSAEIDILQTNSGNSASVEQYGRGQSARIEQSGSSNVASIVQQMNSTNATAVIRQLGSGNSYNVNQITPGEYIVVTQTGSNNSANNVVSRPGH